MQIELPALLSKWLLWRHGRRLDFLFFFQAEDGIRALYVTGVQTCALPISWTSPVGGTASAPRPAPTPSYRRSEERRVGKECRSRRPPFHWKIKAYAIE